MTTRSELDWRSRLPQGVRPYFEPAPLAALFLGISSGFAFSMIGATLTTRLAQHGITKSAVTAFALTFLAYNFKFLWAPIVDNYRLPLIGRFGQRRSWLWLDGGIFRLRGLCAAGDAGRSADGRARAPPRAGQAARCRRGDRRLLRSADRIPEARGRAHRPALRADPQNRRHAGQPYAASPVRRSRFYE